jgi:hypothetical protein
MTLKLPTPLSYDDVDAIIDATVVFENIGGYWQAYPKGPDNRMLPRSNCSNQLILLVNDHYSDEIYDEDGYIYWPGGGVSHIWEATELSEEDVQYILDYM